MEEWKTYRCGEYEYEISNYGNVKSKFRKGFLNGSTDKDGYVIIKLGGRKSPKSEKLHRIVALLFVDNPNEYNEVNHKDGDKTNNKATNLEWVTHSENILHAYRVLGIPPHRFKYKRRNTWKKPKIAK